MDVMEERRQRDRSRALFDIHVKMSTPRGGRGILPVRMLVMGCEVASPCCWGNVALLRNALLVLYQVEYGGQNMAMQEAMQHCPALALHLPTFALYSALNALRFVDMMVSSYF